MPNLNWFRRNLFAPMFARRDGLNYTQWLRGLQAELDAAADPTTRERMQIDRCGAMLEHAYATSAYYRDLFDRHGFRPDSFRDLRDLAAIPVFEKETIAANQERIRSTAVPAADLIASATGGTTGNSFAFWYDRACWSRRHALTVLANEALGWRIGDPTAIVWNAHQDLPPAANLKSRIRNHLTRRADAMDATVIDEAILARWCDTMRRRRTEILYGYAQSVREIAAFLEATGRELPDVRLVVTTAEPLYPADAALLRRVFRCGIRDRYASREHGPMAQQDDDGDMRILANSMILETDAAPGETGDILVTDLWNRAFPFIRYRIGDTSAIASRQGSGLPVMGPLTGRVTDFLIAEDGAKVSGMTFHEVYFDPARNDFGSDRFERIQFAQIAPRTVEIRIVPGPTHQREEDEVRLAALVRKLLGQGMDVRFRYLDEIPRTASGKFRFTICEVPSGS